jgi:hypothetical protein
LRYGWFYRLNFNWRWRLYRLNHRLNRSLSRPQTFLDLFHQQVEYLIYTGWLPVVHNHLTSL